MAQGFDANAARQAGYSDDDILQHLTQSRKFDVDSALKAGYSKQDIIGHLSSTAAPAQQASAPTPQSALSRLGSAFWEGSGGKAMLDLIAGPSPKPGGAQKKLEQWKAVVHGLANEPARIWDQLGQSGESMIAGHPADAMFHLAGATPIVGAPAQQVAMDFDNGDYATGFGHAMGLLLPFAAGAVKAKVPIIPAVGQGNPTEAAALNFLEERGVPVPAGARTGNAFVKNIQKASDSTPLGAVVAQKAQAETTAALRAEAARQVGVATPSTAAEAHYTDFRRAESDPGSLRSVPTGEVDKAGNPVMADMPMPVPVGVLKQTLQPIFDEMSWMPAADRNASAGYAAVKKILEGPDYIPASQAEIGLGGIKKMAREGAGRNSGLGKFIAPKLQDIIDRAVGDVGGSTAVDALQQGRSAAASEAGRDWLTDTFKKAEAEGGFNREQGVWADWLRLKDEAKRTMFTPQQTSDLNKFFLGVKKLAENPNPSGTAVLGTSAGSAGLVLTHPTTGIPLVLGAGALSKLLHSPAGVRALTDGLSVPIEGPGAALAAGQILRLVGNKAEE